MKAKKEKRVFTKDDEVQKVFRLKRPVAEAFKQIALEDRRTEKETLSILIEGEAKRRGIKIKE